MKEIDLFLATNDSMPLGIEDGDYDLEGDIHFLEELLNNDSLSLPEIESSNLDHFNDPSSPRPLRNHPDVKIPALILSRDTGVVVTNKVDSSRSDDALVFNLQSSGLRSSSYLGKSSFVIRIEPNFSTFAIPLKVTGESQQTLSPLIKRNGELAEHATLGTLSTIVDHTSSSRMNQQAFFTREVQPHKHSTDGNMLFMFEYSKVLAFLERGTVNRVASDGTDTQYVGSSSIELEGGSTASLLARDTKTELGGFTYVKEVVKISPKDV
ncbi:hypothetical protein Tco_0016304 [Tanacetum coccineum]